MSIIIDERLKSHIPPLRPDEYAQLEANILRDGCQSPLTLWNDTLLDGHNRYAICMAHGLPYESITIKLPNIEAAIDWIEDNQLGRRNLTADQFAYFIGRKYARTTRGLGGPRVITNDQRPVGQNDPLLDVVSKRISAEVAAEHGIGEKTVRRAAEFADGVDAMASVLGDGVRTQILDGKSDATRTDFADVGKLLPEAVKNGLVFTSPEEVFKYVAEERKKKSKIERDKNDAVRAAAPTRTDGKYETIVIDPPWEMKKIERDVAPNQVDFEYPTMTEDELAAFDVVGMAAEDCHLFCWTTQKHLRQAMRLIEVWGFKYILCMVWHKNGGFQPFGLPQYNCEFCLYAKRGNPDFSETKAFPTCFNAPRREHSRKPDEFYDMIRRVTYTGRIDVFSREKRDGFAQFGNEADKFSEAS